MWRRFSSTEATKTSALRHFCTSVEDQGGKARLEDVRYRFGESVARIVEACSDSLADTAKGEQKAHWRERKEAYLAHMRLADEDTLWVSLADKVHNGRTILRDLRKPDIGEKVWARNQPSQHYQRCRQTQNCHCEKYLRVGRRLCQKLDHPPA